MKTVLICGLASLRLVAGAGEAARALYENDFEKAEPGKLPEELMVLSGEFTIKAEGTNRFLELPGSPLDSYGALFGPTEKEGVSVSARIFGTAKGRRAPTFGVGLNGAGGWKLQVSPGKKAVELFKDLELKASAPFDWKSGEWTHFRLQVRPSQPGRWKIEGKVWTRGTDEPGNWTLSFEEQEEPIPGKASVLGSPFSGTPIWFDDLRVTRIEAK
jgi:hypothetical protein